MLARDGSITYTFNNGTKLLPSYGRSRTVTDVSDGPDIVY